MTQPQILTAVRLVVPQDRESDVVPAYRELTADGSRPEGLLRSMLLRGHGGHRLIQIVWRDRAAIMAARNAGAPQQPSFSRSG